jgi:hypothetical protein
MKYFDGGGKRAVWVVHRRGGKDNTLLNQTAKMALTRVGTYWHLLPSQRQGRKVVWEGIDKQGRRIIDQAFPLPIRASTNNTEMAIKFRNGSIVQVVGSDSFDSLVGSNPIHVTFSEWSLSKPSAWSFIRPILAENEGTAAFIYTPRGKNHGHKIYEMARNNPAWFCSLQTIEDTGALSLDVLAEERAAGMPEDLIQQEYYCDFNSGNAGSYYAFLLEQMESAGLIADFAHNFDEVYTHWDIGFTDSTAIIFWRFRPDGGVDILDSYEAHGMTVNHYIELLASKPYQYKAHFLPHDANDSRFKFATGLTIKEQIRAALPNVHITPKLTIEDGIQAARYLLGQKTRIHKGQCSDLLAALENYRREYDEDTRTYDKAPVHDWSSHYADSFRYLAVSVRAIRDLSLKLPEAKPKQLIMTLDNLFDDNEHHARYN